MKEFSDILKDLRNKNNLSQEALANIVHVSRSSIAKYENGLGLPSDDVINALCDYFNVDREYLFPKEEVEKIIVDKNVKLNNEKIKSAVIFASFSLVIVILVSIIISLFIPFINENKLDSVEVSYNINDKDKYQTDIVLFKYEGGYVYQRLELHEYPFTDKSNLYLVRVMNTYVNGHVAYLNDFEGFKENEMTESVYMDIEFDQSKNINPLVSWLQKDDKTFSIISKYSNNQILLNETQELFDGAYIYKQNDRFILNYKSNITDLLLDKEMNTLIRRAEIKNNIYKSSWKYDMLEDYSKFVTFTIYSNYLIEAKIGENIDFNVNTKMINSTMSIEQSKLFHFSI